MAQVGINKKTGITTETRNKAGGIAYDITDPSTRLMHLVGTMFNEEGFYPDSPGNDDSRFAGMTSEAQALVTTAEEIAQGDNWRDLLAIAAYTRQDLNLRTVPTVLYAIAAEFGANRMSKNNKPWLRAYSNIIMQRADEPRKVFAAWRHLYGGIQRINGRAICTNHPKHRLKRAISERLREFPEHLLAKYDSTGSPSLRDTIRACARDVISLPKIMYFVDRSKWAKMNPEVSTPILYARTKLSELTEFNDEAIKLAKQARATWEILSSQFGKSKEMWSFVAGSMGYMATLRNLRNMVEVGVDLKTAGVLSKLADKDEVLGSKQLPFRFLSAARIFDASLGSRSRSWYDTPSVVTSNQTQSILNALDDALDHSVENLPEVPGVTAIFVDNSGSMDCKVSGKSTITAVDAGNMLAAILGKRCEEVYTCAFTDKPYEVVMRKKDSVLTNMKAIAKAGGDGGSTNAYLCAPWLQQKGVKADRIILVSDMQCWDSYSGDSSFRGSVMKYRTFAGKDVWLHSINIAGAKEAQVASSDKNVNLMSGFSEKILNYIMDAENALTAAKDAGEKAPKGASLDSVRSKYIL